MARPALPWHMVQPSAVAPPGLLLVTLRALGSRSGRLRKQRGLSCVLGCCLEQCWHGC